MLGVACAAYDAPAHHGCPRRGGGYTRLSMTAIEEVVQIRFFQGMPAEALRDIAAQSSVLTLEPGRILIAQHAAAEHLFFLMSGSVQIYIHFHGVDDLLVGTMREPGLCSAGRLFASRTATPRRSAAKRTAGCCGFRAKP